MGSPAMTNRATGSQAAETVEHITVIPIREHSAPTWATARLTDLARIPTITKTLMPILQ